MVQRIFAALRIGLAGALALCAPSAISQQTAPPSGGPTIVEPGAPGKATPLSLPPLPMPAKPARHPPKPTSTSFVWPATFTTARAYLDELARGSSVSANQIAAINADIAKVEALHSRKDIAKLKGEAKTWKRK